MSEGSEQPQPQQEPATAGERRDRAQRRRQRAFTLEAAFTRLVATGGVIGVGVALGAILTSQEVTGWIVGLVVATVTVALTAIVWHGREP